MNFHFCPLCGENLTTRQIDGKARRCCASDGCDYVHWDNPTPVVAMLVEHEGDIILARNKTWPQGMLSIQTGFLESGESPERCALREVSEELGLTGESANFIGYYAFHEQNQLILAFHVRCNGEIQLGDELAEYKRIPPEKLKPWNFGAGLAVRDWLSKQGLLAL
ncbi:MULTISPECIES: NUDIX domain-containing protein [unclassified Hahella]|uniref:NUDIX domain-containing protein n=1 Tax=unclassified Hahella TaxID=2624107 RepID=UPI001C1ECF1E|nr:MULTISPECIES: NUDIX domain-containing protein [unclassified Hahella]MBU6950620.1 NUDIX domain-containing protein [Hahella sp. HN01]MDG9669827.1 NUDIX domain-containing protein [Hahella sp. CR1]